MESPVMRYLLLIFIATIFPLTALAIEAPTSQVRINADKILRGNFEEVHQIRGTDTPVITSGTFVVAPAQGLIWNIVHPFPTSTIITPNNAAQVVGGLVVKLPVKNLRHLYEMVGGALAGDWSKLETDYVIKRSSTATGWQMLLTPRHTKAPILPYTVITISGTRFVENIIMTNPDGRTDELTFTNNELSTPPLATKETTLFNKIRA